MAWICKHTYLAYVTTVQERTFQFIRRLFNSVFVAAEASRPVSMMMPLSDHLGPPNKIQLQILVT